METELVYLDVGSRRLALEQVRDLSALVKESRRSGETQPYWAYLWPSARALAAAIALGPDLTGKRVLDLGCGLGAVGLAAAVRGAEVTLSDLNPEALSIAQRNAERNQIAARTLELDWNRAPLDLELFDGIVAADVFYEDRMMRGVLRFVRRYLVSGGVAAIADPVRVMEAGVLGAAKLAGLEVEPHLLVPGTTMTGGVTLYLLRQRRR